MRSRDKMLSKAAIGEAIEPVVGYRGMALNQHVVKQHLALAAGLIMMAAACSSSDSAGIVNEPNQANSSSESSESVGPPTSSELEKVPSALRGDRRNENFPPALVDVGDIQSGGPGPDGIPPIDDPVFAAIDEIDFLSDEEAVIVVEVDGDVRGYPVQILIWHEIVNDSIGGVPVTVTYCPLCNSALAFDRRVGDRVLDFGTSGELYQSALVMYDRQTESLWAHFTGQALVGHLAGEQLDLIPAQTLSFSTFAQNFPDALVLTRETGNPRSYGLNPYVGYDDKATDPIGAFISQPIDDTLAAKERIVGIIVPGGPIAVTLSQLADRGVVNVSSHLNLDDGGATADGNTDGSATVDGIVLFHQSGLASALEDKEIDGGRDVGQTGAFLAVDSDGDDLTFVLGEHDEGFIDEQTGSTWTIAGEAIAGPKKGAFLTPVPHVDTFWFAWSTYRPDTRLLDLAE